MGCFCAHFLIFSNSYRTVKAVSQWWHNTQHLNLNKSLLLYCSLFSGHIKKRNLHLKAAGGCSLVQHEQKEKLSQMQSCIQQIHMQSLVVAVEGSVWKCCSKIKSFISFGGSKNLQSPQLRSVVLYKLWLVWGNLACKNYNYNCVFQLLFRVMLKLLSPTLQNAKRLTLLCLCNSSATLFEMFKRAFPFRQHHLLGLLTGSTELRCEVVWFLATSDWQGSS